MDFHTIASIVAPLAPGLGSLLGGLIPFPGGSYAGQKVGEMIARQFGVEATPQAIEKAITTSPNDIAIAKLDAAWKEAQAEWPALAEMEKAWSAVAQTSIAETNETMRIEVRPENRHWYFTGWRPFAGWEFNFFACIYGLLIAAAVILAARGNQLMITAIKDVQTIAGSLLGALAMVVGVSAIGRSFEKKARIETGSPPALPSKPAKR